MEKVMNSKAMIELESQLRKGHEDSMFRFLKQRDGEIVIMDALVHVPSNDGPQQTLRINVSDVVDLSAGTNSIPSEPQEPGKS